MVGVAPRVTPRADAKAIKQRVSGFVQPPPPKKAKLCG